MLRKGRQQLFFDEVINAEYGCRAPALLGSVRAGLCVLFPDQRTSVELQSPDDCSGKLFERLHPYQVTFVIDEPDRHGRCGRSIQVRRS